MEVEVQQSRLAKALSNMSKIAASTRAGLPILSNVLLRTSDNNLILTATNLEIAIVEYVNAKIIKAGTITVPAKLLADFVSNLPKEDVKLKAVGDKMTVKCGAYKSMINGILADDYPELPLIEEDKAVTFKVDIETFKEAVSQVIVAASNDTARPALTGVYFNTFENTLYIAATDGYRLADRKFVENVQSEVKAIVPSSTLRDVMGFLTDSMDEVEILISDSQIRFRMGEIEVTSKLIDASFPDYRKLIPATATSEVVLDKTELARMTRMAALFAKQSGGSVVCEANADEGKFSVMAVASELGENVSSIETKIDASDKVTLNSRYLLDVINVLQDTEMKFSFSGKLAPVVIRQIKNDNYTHIVMPLKS